MHYMLLEETQMVISKSDMPLEYRSFSPKPSHHCPNNTPVALIPGGFSITSSLCTHCSESPTGRIFVSSLPWWNEQKWRPRQKSAGRLFWSPVRRGLVALLASLFSRAPSLEHDSNSAQQARSRTTSHKTRLLFVVCMIKMMTAIRYYYGLVVARLDSRWR